MISNDNGWVYCEHISNSCLFSIYLHNSPANTYLTDEEMEACHASEKWKADCRARIQICICLASMPRSFITWKGLSVILGDSFGVPFSVKSTMFQPCHFWKQQFLELKLQFFRLGGWHLSWGITAGSVIAHHNCGGAYCKESREGGSQLENQKRRTWLHLAENSYFVQLSRSLIPSMVTSHSISTTSQSPEAVGPCDVPTPPPKPLAKEQGKLLHRLKSLFYYY